MANIISRSINWLRQWFTTAESRPHVGRNDPCWCGSGKKYKHCHMNADVRRGTLTKHTTPNAQRAMMERANKRMEKQRERMKRK